MASSDDTVVYTTPSPYGDGEGMEYFANSDDEDVSMLDEEGAVEGDGGVDVMAGEMDRVRTIAESFFVNGEQALYFIDRMARDGEMRVCAYTSRMMEYLFSNDTAPLGPTDMYDAEVSPEALAHLSGLTAAASIQIQHDNLGPASLSMGANKVPPLLRLLRETQKETELVLQDAGRRNASKTSLVSAEPSVVVQGQQRVFTLAVGPEDFNKRASAFIEAGKVPPRSFLSAATYAEIAQQ